MLKKIGVVVTILSLGVYVVALACSRPQLQLSVVEKLNVIHLVSLYIAIVVYVANSIKRLPFANVSCVALLLLSSYTGIVVELWRFVGVEKGFIPPFVFVLSCAESSRMLCDHFASFEISVPLITAFITLCWGIYRVVKSSIRKARGSQDSGEV